MVVAMVVAAYAASHAAADDIASTGEQDYVAPDAAIDYASFGSGGESCDCSCCPDPWGVSREPI
jgi:hypothetical protein